MTLVGGPVAPGSYQNKAETDRLLIQSIFGFDEGIIKGFALTPNAGSLALDITAGSAVIQGENTAAQGAYFVADDAASTRTFPAPSAQNRIDALVLCIRDSQYGTLPGGTSQGPAWEVVQGTPSGSPVAPIDATITTAVGPGAWIRVANVQINVGNTVIASGNITRIATAVLDQAPTMQIFTANGTWTRPDGARWVRVRVVGGGGAGGGCGAPSTGEGTCGSGGSAGGYAESVLGASAVGPSQAVTVGAAGQGALAANGGSGGNSSFGSLVAASGGTGGALGGSVTTTGAAVPPLTPGGGVGTAGQLLLKGQAGTLGIRAAQYTRGGTGGSSILGGGAGTFGTGLQGNPGGAYGSGGSGANSGPGDSSHSGGDGAGGVVIVETFF